MSKGHKHHFDHISILSKGTVEVSVNGAENKVFTAPCFIVIKKDHNHVFKALTDDVFWFCVFALRDIDGNTTDIYSGDNSPYGRADASPPEHLINLYRKTVQE